MSAPDRVGQYIGGYRILRQLGQGAFAAVYLVEHLYLEKQAAIKVFDTPIMSEDARRFVSEARIVARLIHPHIMPIHDFGMENDAVFIVIDYAAYGSLRKRHPRGAQIPLPVVVSYVKQIASALQYAHDHHIIHRDVKPENMLLLSDDKILLSDFGITALTYGVNSQSRRETAETVTYTAPEQLLGRPSFASDQYALAVVVYEWLCGEPPFQGNPISVMAQHVSSLPQPLRAKNTEIPKEVEDVILQALAKEPRERFRTVQDFTHTLEAAVALEQDKQIFPSYLSVTHGESLINLKHDEEPLAASEEAIRLAPESSEAYRGRGEALINLKRYEEALAAFDEALRLDPESIEAYRGRAKVYEQLAQQSYDKLKQRAQQSYERGKELTTDLTEREIEVLRLLAQGLNTPQVARTLYISKNTVEHHLAHIYQKIGVTSRTAAVAYAVQQGLV